MVPCTVKIGKPVIRLVVAVALALPTLALPTLALADQPEIGEVQKLKAITFSLQVGSMDRETKRVTYTPPPGWYVRSHTVECAAKHGNISFSVSTVPQQWRWSTDQKIDESSKVLLDAAAQVQKVGVQGRVRHHRSYNLDGLQTVRATHHALVLDVTAKGEGFLKGGAGLELTVVADLVYLGTEANALRPDSTADLDGAIGLGRPVAAEH